MGGFGSPYLMKIKITANPITMYGTFQRGQVITDKEYPIAFLNHLVHEAGAAVQLDYETKTTEVVVKKKPLSTQSLPQAKALPKKTRAKRKKTVQ